MASKLTTLSTSYQSFQEDQVLTHDQLNKFLAYFDDQDRLSRVMLSGVGLSCGFEVKHEVIDGNARVRISKGVGVTTDGDILNLLNKNEDGELSVNQTEKNYPYYREFIDEKANYQHFIQGGSPLAPMYELITSSEFDASLGDQPISALTGYQNRVVVLYIEAFQNEGELCDGLSCDNQGIEEVSRLRVLLLTKSQADHVISLDPLYRKNDRREVYHQLKDLAVKRVVLDANEYANPLDLSLKFAVGNESPLISDLKTSLQTIANKLQGYIPSTLIPSINSKIDSKMQAGSGISSGYFQYRHDFLIEIVDIYNRLKDLFLLFSSECVPPLQSFPKHLMLGVVNPSVEDLKYLRYRHQFYKSSLLEDFGEEFGDFMFLLNRMDTMLNSYIELPGSSSFNRQPIRITPSYLEGEVGQGAVPFYYEPTDNLLKAWNPQKTYEGKFKRNLSYHISALVQLPQFTAPLNYNFRKNDMFRIEGHQGKNYIEAFEAIDGLKKSKGLPFDVKVLALNENAETTINYDDYACHFEDLQLLLEAWSKEQQCTLSKATALLSGFSIVVPGTNVVDAVFDAPIGTMVLYENYIPNYYARGEAIEARLAGKESAPTTSSTSKKSKPSTTESRMAMTESSSGKNQASMIYTGGGDLIYSTTPVEDNLSKEDNTVGAAFLYALQNADTAAPVSWIAQAEYFSGQVLELNPEVQWNEDAYQVLITNSFSLLAYAQALSGSVPIALSGINTTVVNNYQTKISNLCTAVSQAQLAYTNSLDIEGINTSVSSKNRTILGLAVNQLNIICCAAEKIKTLFEEINERKNEIISKSVLTQFKKYHPSLEHIAGVQPGGTFVMVYNNLGGSKIVIADFALPYMCCSDCAPVNYVLNQPTTTLQLTGASPICLENSEEVRRNFIVQPVDGEITADQEIAGLSIDGNELVIDPATFPDANFGDTINFLVNGQPTGTSVQIGKKLQVTFPEIASPVFNPNMTFTPTGPDLGQVADFKWDFGDGASSTLQAPTHTYNFDPGTVNTITVRLTVTAENGLCANSISRTFTIVRPRLDIADGYTYCAKSAVPHTITIVPSGYFNNSDINWNNKEHTGNQFIPSEATASADGKVIILLNEQNMATITLCEPPEVEGLISYDSQLGRFEFKITGDRGSRATWEFRTSDGTVIDSIENAEVKESFISEAIKEKLASEAVFAFLTIYDDDCCKDGVTKEIGTLIIPTEVEPDPIPIPTPVTKTLVLTVRKYCVDNGNTFSIIISPASQTGIITINGVRTNQFRPNTFSAGSDVPVTLDGVFQFNIKICAALPALPADVTVSNSGTTFDFSGSDVDSKLIFYKENQKDEIGDPINNPDFSNEIPFSKNIKEEAALGKIFVKLYVKNDCCENEKMYPVNIPGELDCLGDVTEKMAKLRQPLLTIVTNTDGKKQYSTKFQPIFGEISKYFTDSSNTGPILASGSKNADIATKFSSWFTAIYAELKENTGLSTEAKNKLIELYGLLLQILTVALQCQDSSKFDDSGIVALLGLIESQTDPVNQEAFVNFGIDIDPTHVITGQATSSLKFSTSNEKLTAFLNALVTNLPPKADK